MEPLRRMLAQDDVHTALTEHWGFICDNINYVPIFRLAREVLLAIPSTSHTDGALRKLILQALQIVSERAALRHDLMGRVFHQLLLEAKYLGTFYTSVPAATLLLKMALAPERWPSVDWADQDAIQRLRIADLACGTGTLLMATNQSITDNFIRTKAASTGVDAGALRSLHRLLIEDVLHGYDVLSSAVHLTASTLSLLAPEIAFHKMQLFSMPLGKMADGEIKLGSIDFLDSDRVAVQLDIMGGSSAESRRMTTRGDTGSQADLPKLDMCVMNPPFVRSVGGNLLFGSYPEHRAEMKRELSQRLRRGRVHASATAGLGSVFIAVADRHMKPGGRMALVIPAAITSGISWAETRGLIEATYDTEIVAASHHAKRWAFSENTELSEVLIVAHKERTSSHASCSFLNLWRNPESTAEAIALADSVAHAAPPLVSRDRAIDHGTCEIIVGDVKWGEMLSIPLAETRGHPWLGCAFAQTDLVRTNWLLHTGKLSVPGAASAVDIPICPLGNLVELGPDRRDIHDGFTLGETRTAYPALWGHGAEVNRTMKATPNMYLTPRARPAPGRPSRPVSLLWPKAGRGMLVERQWYPTQSIVATRLREPALSNVWFPVRPRSISDDAEKALILWLNSTLGILLVAGHRVPTRGPWVQFKKPTWTGMPVLNVSALDGSAVRRLAIAYDRLAQRELQPFPAMGTDLVRQNIDAEIRSAIGLPSIDRLRSLLAIEPIICDKSLSAEIVTRAAASSPPEQLGLELGPVRAGSRVEAPSVRTGTATAEPRRRPPRGPRR